MSRITTTTALTSLGLFAALAGAAPSFTTGTAFATAQNPSAAAVGDFNNDGRADVAVTVDTPDRVLVFAGTGGGGFAAPVPIILGAGVGSRDLFATDVDGDHDVDLVVVLHNINTMRVLLNNGTGTFSAGSSATVGSNARGSAMADFNGDGRADFATANRDSNTVSIVTNNAGVLSSVSLTTGSDPRAVGAGNLDADGDNDLAVTNHGDRTVSLFTNTGGAFTAAGTVSVPGGTRPTGAAIAEVTGDAMADLIVTADDANAGLNWVLVYRRTGSNTFAAPLILNTVGVNPGSVIAGDLDGDGDLDLVASNEDSGNISIFENLGGGTFGAAQLMITGTNPERATLADVDDDGSPDLLVPNRDSGTTSKLINQLEAAGCPADLDNGSGTGVRDQAVTVDDLLFFLARFEAGSPAADLDNGSGLGTPDLAVTIDDLLFFLVHFEGGC